MLDDMPLALKVSLWIVIGWGILCLILGDFSPEREPYTFSDAEAKEEADEVARMVAHARRAHTERGGE